MCCGAHRTSDLPLSTSQVLQLQACASNRGLAEKRATQNGLGNSISLASTEQRKALLAPACQCPSRSFLEASSVFSPNCLLPSEGNIPTEEVPTSPADRQPFYRPGRAGKGLKGHCANLEQPYHLIEIVWRNRGGRSRLRIHFTPCKG